MNTDARLNILVLNQTWFVDELRSLGHRVVSAGWTDRDFDIQFKFPATPFNEILKTLPSGFKPERIVYLDDSGPLSVMGLSDVNVPTLFYSVDAHHHSWWHGPFCAVFDKVLVAQKNYVDSLTRYSPDAAWLPLWAPIEIEPAAERTIDVCFRGNLDASLHPKRAKFFARLGELTNLDVKTGRYTEAFPAAKIVVNQAVKDDLNFRVFETMMCGALLLTPRVDNGLLDLFREGKHLVCYEDGNADDAAEKCNYYLEHESERARIAATGRQAVLEAHRPAARAAAIDKHLRRLTVTERPFRYFGEGATMYTGSTTIRRISPRIADRVLDAAATMLRRSAARREIESNAFMTAVHFCKYEYEKRGDDEKSIALIRDILGCFPEKLLVALSLIESLVRVGRREEALDVARTFGADPEELLEKAEQTLAPFRNEIFQELDRLEAKRAERLAELFPR